jgi:hypothetical protein
MSWSGLFGWYRTSFQLMGVFPALIEMKIARIKSPVKVRRTQIKRRLVKSWGCMKAI